MNADPLIEFRSVSRTYGQGQAEILALDDVDLTVYPGEFVAIMGSSGSGKSTCMNLIGCLDSPSSGEYRFQGVNTGQLSNDQRALLRRNFLGFVFQGFNLLDRTTALENVELPLIYRGMSREKRHAMALNALGKVGLEDRAQHTPAELSGGQQQRVAIARAIVTNPAILLADEPTGNLDTQRSHEFMQLLVELNKEEGLTVVMVTHEADMAGYAQRIIHFLDGKIESDQSVEAAS